MPDGRTAPIERPKVQIVSQGERAACNRVRINKAKELIQATHLGIGEIGYLVGISDPYYFSKLFKKMVGLPPMQHYKKVRESSEEPGPA
ncbi:MAG TPA: helix-turn-helix domain-containing protein [Paenibacillaceae bacterium]